MDRKVLVTGAGSGFGLEISLELARLGFTVIGLVPTESESDLIKRSSAQAQVQVEPLVVDLSDAKGRSTAAKDLQLWGLVNNAGYMNAGLLRDVPLNEVRKQLEAMVLAPLDLSLQALPYMIARGQGRIVNVTSAASHLTTPLSGWYNACKAAFRELNDALRLELLGTGVDVVDVEPGAFDTGIWDRAREELSRHRERSRRPSAYDHALRNLERLKERASDPQRVGQGVGETMTVGRPPAHLRLGADAVPMRVVSELVPARLMDRVVALASVGRRR